MSTTFFNRVSQCLTRRGYDCSVTTPTGRPVFNAALGTFFRQTREYRGLGLRQAAMAAVHSGLSRISKATLSGLERGRTKHIDPDVLRELALLYGLDYQDLAKRVVSVQYGLTDLSIDRALAVQHADPPLQDESATLLSELVAEIRSLRPEQRLLVIQGFLLQARSHAVARTSGPRTGSPTGSEAGTPPNTGTTLRPVGSYKRARGRSGRY